MAGRARFRFGGYEFVGHAEEVAEHLGSDAAEADQNHGIWEVMIGDVVHVGRFGEEMSAIGDVDADGQGAGLSRRIHGSAGQQLAVNFEGASAVGGRFLNAGEFERKLSDNIETGSAFRHGNLRRSLSREAASCHVEID